MDYFNYKKSNLFAENVDVETIVSEVGTPVYIYSKATFKHHLQKVQQAYSELDTTICYSVKACGNINILKFMAEPLCQCSICCGAHYEKISRYSGIGLSRSFAIVFHIQTSSFSLGK